MMKKEEALREILTATIICLLSLSMFSILAPKAQAQTLDRTLVVYVGAHPDDVDIGMSGSLYKYDLGKHPILWVVVTDGGASSAEYDYEIDPSRNWLASDGQNNTGWVAPDGSSVTRQFYSADLAKKRCGGYFDGLNWIDVSASHGSVVQRRGVEYDWRTRVGSFLGTSVEKIQLSYLDPNDPTKRLMYPDGALSSTPTITTIYTNSIAMNLADEINKFVESKGYQKNLIDINSHAPDEVCTNANEHLDHEITGNAVRQAIDLLHTNYGFGEIDATWYTIYTGGDPAQTRILKNR